MAHTPGPAIERIEGDAPPAERSEACGISHHVEDLDPHRHRVAGDDAPVVAQLHPLREAADHLAQTRAQREGGEANAREDGEEGRRQEQDADGGPSGEAYQGPAGNARRAEDDAPGDGRRPQGRVLVEGDPGHQPRRVRLP